MHLSLTSFEQEFRGLQQTIDPLSDISLMEVFNNVLQFVGRAIIKWEL